MPLRLPPVLLLALGLAATGAHAQPRPAAPNPAAPDTAGHGALARDAHAALAARYGADATAALRVRVVRTGRAPGAETAGPLRPDLPARPAPPRGPVQVGLVDPDGARRGWALLHVARFDTVVVAARPLVRGRAVTAADVSVVVAETTAETAPLLRPADLAGPEGAAADSVVATRYVPAGAVLRARDLRRPPAVAPGAPVTLTYVRNGLALDLACRATAAAALGEPVRLTCPGTPRAYRAVLTAPDAARWVATL